MIMQKQPKPSSPLPRYQSMMRTLAPALVLLAVLLAGCAHEDRAGPDDQRLGGTLTEDVDDEGRADLQRRAEQRGATLNIMESFPEQFDIRPFSPSECDNLALELSQLDYIAEVGECRPIP